MKKILFLLVLFLVVTDAKASFDLSKWKFYKNISNVSQGLIAITPDNEIYAGSKANSDDIRVIDSNNQEIAYKLLTLNSQTQTSEYFARLLNNSATPGKNSSVILDLGKRGLQVNNIRLVTSSKNFQRNVIVYGSDDMANWNLLNSDGYIFDFTDSKENIKEQKMSVRIPESVFQYYKIEILDLENKPIIVTSASVLLQERSEQTLFDASIASTDIRQNPNNQTTEIILDMGQNGIPVKVLNILSSEQNYKRGISLYSSNDRNSQNWQYVGQGYVFNFNTPKFNGASNSLTFHETTNRFIKLIIFNNDDAPININSILAKAQQKQIVFQANGNQTYRIFYGNSDAVAPQYDLETYFKYLDLNQVRKATLDKQQGNTNFTPQLQPLSERLPYLLPITLCAVGLLLLILVFRFLKK